jgi:hypothetical protein
MALTNVTIEVIWLQQLLSKLGFPQSTPILIYFDSQSTTF